MRQFSKISFSIYLIAISSMLMGLVSGSDAYGNVSYSDIAHDVVSGSEDLLFATPYPALLLSEIMVDKDSEIEPRESGSVSFLSASDPAFGIKAYLKKSKQISISLTIKDLIFPFHTHF